MCWNYLIIFNLVNQLGRNCQPPTMMSISRSFFSSQNRCNVANSRCDLLSFSYRTIADAISRNYKVGTAMFFPTSLNTIKMLSFTWCVQKHQSHVCVSRCFFSPSRANSIICYLHYSNVTPSSLFTTTIVSFKAHAMLMSINSPVHIFRRFLS